MLRTVYESTALTNCATGPKMFERDYSIGPIGLQEEKN